MSGDYGYFIVPRGSLDHPAFDPGQPFCRGRAWVWLLERAAWRPRMIDVCGRTVLIERGQLCYSLASLAKAWNWPIGKVRRFIERLKTDTKVDTVADPGRLLITICNYDQIQSSTGRAPAQAGMDGDMPATRQQHDDDTLFKKGKPSKKEIKESDPSGLVPQRPEIDAVARPESTRSIALGDLQEAKETWNAMAARQGLSVVRDLSPRRKQALIQRLRQCGGLNGWQDALKGVEASAFLLGTGNNCWKADFDWLVKEANFTRVLEGVYAKRGSGIVDRGAWLSDELARGDGVTLEHEP